MTPHAEREEYYRMLAADRLALNPPGGYTLLQFRLPRLCFQG